MWEWMNVASLFDTENVKWNIVYIFTTMNIYERVFLKNIGFYGLRLRCSEATVVFITQNESIQHQIFQKVSFEKWKIFHWISSKVLYFHFLFIFLPNGTFSYMATKILDHVFSSLSKHSVVRLLSV